MKRSRMTLNDVKRLAIAKHPPLNATILRVRLNDPDWYRNALELYARRAAVDGRVKQ